MYVNSVCIGNDSIADLVEKKQLIEHGIALYCKIYMYVIYDTLYEFMILIQTPAMYMCLMYTFEDKCKHGQIYLKLYQSEKMCFEWDMSTHQNTKVKENIGLNLKYWVWLCIEKLRYTFGTENEKENNSKETAVYCLTKQLVQHV